MVSLKKILPSNFSEIYPLLRGHNPELGEDVWRTLFDYRWTRSSDYCGYGLFDDSSPVGYLGMIFSQREVDCMQHEFCNLTSWVVRPDYRSHSISMMMPIIRLKDHTLTDLSSTDGVAKISERLGFQKLDTSIRVLFPLPIALGQMNAQELRFYSDDEISGLNLDQTDKTIFEDHRSYANCHQLVLQINQQYCYLIYTTSRDSRFSYCHIQFISDISLFEHYQSVIRRRISRDTKIPLIVVDSRLTMSANILFSLEIPLASPLLSLSKKLRPDQIDNLYSEIVLLDLKTNFGLTQQLLEAFPMIRNIKSLISKSP